MDTQQKVIAERFFKLKVLESKGSSFQTLFEEVMVRVSDDFVRVKPHGNIGDRKNDGFRSGEGIYYQVYAPENPKEKESDAVKKAV